MTSVQEVRRARWRCVRPASPGGRRGGIARMTARRRKPDACLKEYEPMEIGRREAKEAAWSRRQPIEILLPSGGRGCGSGRGAGRVFGPRRTVGSVGTVSVCRKRRPAASSGTKLVGGSRYEIFPGARITGPSRRLCRAEPVASSWAGRRAGSSGAHMAQDRETFFS